MKFNEIFMRDRPPPERGAFLEIVSLKVVCSALMMEKCTRSTGMISAVRGGEEVQIMAEVAVATVPTGGLVADRQTSRLASAVVPSHGDRQTTGRAADADVVDLDCA